MPTARSRIWFGVTALCVAGGVLISVFTAAQNSTGHFSTPVERAFNTLVFFTIQSNLIVGVTVLLLALKPERSSPAFGVCRLIGVVAITVTSSGTSSYTRWCRSWRWSGGWPSVHGGGTSARAALWSAVFPLCWLGFTLIRGAFGSWYPYPFIDVTKLGYGGAVLNCLWVSLLWLGLAGGATVVDRHLGRALAVP